MNFRVSEKVPEVFPCFGFERKRLMASPHAVILSMEGPGHWNPLLELSGRLVHQHGFKITFILSQATICQRLGGWQQNHPGIRFVGVPDGRPEGGFKAMEEAQDAQDRMQQPVEEMIKTLDPPPDLIISDEFISWAQDVADKFNTPRVAFWTASTACEIVCSHIPELIAKGYLPVEDNLEDMSLITFLPGIGPMCRTDLPLCFYQKNNSLDFISRGCQRTREAFCVLANTCKELELEAISACQENSRYFPVGPLFPQSLFQEGPLPRDGLSQDDLSCLEWLDEQDAASVLYLAFGSVAVLSPEQVEHILHALEASNRRFLWTLRPNFVANPPEGFLDAVSERAEALGGRLVPWAPQVHVLKHGSIGAFLTHCGWNSTMEAVCSGVKLLAWPCTSEQNMNSKLIVEQWKIGLEVNNEGRKTIAESPKIAGLIGDVMDGGQICKELQANVMKLRETVKAAVTQGGSSHDNLLAFVDLCIRGVDEL